jgi:DNA-binding NarL/FixJ family response regulator
MYWCWSPGTHQQAVGERLFLSDRTVESHLARVFAKLGLGDSPDQHRRVLAVLAPLRG